MNRKNLLFSVIKKIVVPFSFVFLSILGSLSCSFTQDYKLDALSFQIVDYNKILGNSEYKSPILTVTKTKEKITKDGTIFYNDLFNVFHYNILAKGARTIINSSTKLSFDDPKFSDCNLVLTTQPTFSIGNDNLGTEENPIYHIDYGQYYSYFPEIVTRHRGDSKTSFMYISDTLANKIVDMLNIPGETTIEKYKTLITDEKYCYEKMIIDGSESVPVAINNILHTDYNVGQSTRFHELYGDFSLIWADKIKEKINMSFEIDLKSNPYGNKKIVKTVESYGYDVSNSSFSIKTIHSDSYSVNHDLSLNLELALKTNNSAFTYLPFALVQIASFAFCYCFGKKRILSIEVTQTNISLAVLFFTYGVAVTFTYNYPLYTITPFLFLVFWFSFVFLNLVSGKGQAIKQFLKGVHYDKIKI